MSIPESGRLRQETVPFTRDRLYRGWREGNGTVVMVDGQPLPHFRRYSDMFEWGYGGSGPTDLALSLLTDAIGPVSAETHHQAFTRDIVACLSHERWSLTRQMIVDWLQQHVAAHPRWQPKETAR